MLQYASEVNQTMKGLAAVANNHGPLVQLFVNNWPLVGLAGLAIGTRYYRQWRRGRLEFWPAVQDAGVVISPLVSLFILQKIAEEKQHETAFMKQIYSTGKQHGGAVEQPVTQAAPGPDVRVLGRLA